MGNRLFGKTKDGKEVYAYTLENSKGMKAEILDYGCILRSLKVPDGKGGTRDIVLGYDELAPYEKNAFFFGAVIAPSANRISGAKISIDGTDYQLEVNDAGRNNLHSSMKNGSHQRIWNAQQNGNSVSFAIHFNDMDLGFPGNRDMIVTYTLTEDNELKIHYTGRSDRNTIINPTNHSYFNLSGHAAGKITGHRLQLFASKFTVTDKTSIPTGECRDVKGTVMDFTGGRVIGQDIDDAFEQLKNAHGYDHNFVIDNYNGELRKAAVLTDEASGGSMTVFTTLPGIQFYAGNYLEPHKGKGGATYDFRGGMCLETQFFPDAINQPSFESPIFGPGKPYESTTVYQVKY